MWEYVSVWEGKVGEKRGRKSGESEGEGITIIYVCRYVEYYIHRPYISFSIISYIHTYKKKNSSLGVYCEVRLVRGTFYIIHTYIHNS